ncbi:MAG: hypothetical protein GKR91_04290 [Pseudomonadales bacterium]|nr:hypothetical protein [Pseudomonadales bacterium]
MNKLIAILQVVAAVVLGILAIATLVNAILIANRPETISVVNAFIGQGVLIIALLALATICMRKGLKNLRQSETAPENSN